MSDRRFDELQTAVVVDVETTGTDATRDQIIELAMMKLDFTAVHLDVNHVRGHVLYTKLNPGIPIPVGASRVHGIHDADVVGAPSFADEAAEIREFIGQHPIIAHNASFDKRFLNAAFKRAGQKSLHRNRSYCTMKRMREIRNEVDGSWRRNNLEDTAFMLGLPGRAGTHHDAREDINITARIAVTMYLMDSGQIDRRAYLRESVTEIDARYRAKHRSRQPGSRTRSPRRHNYGTAADASYPADANQSSPWGKVATWAGVIFALILVGQCFGD